jgi:hypothetical protein
VNLLTRIRQAAIPVAVAAVATVAAVPVAAEPSATQVISVVPVGPNGEPINGFQETPSPGNVSSVSECTAASLSAVADGIYSCSPSAAGADPCWPSTPGSLLCLDDPWDKQLHRVDYDGPLPPVQAPAISDPVGLLLDDGTRCRLRNGGAWGGRDDGYVGVYGCGGANAVLWLPSQGPGTCVDRSSPAWTVKVGPLGTPTEHFPPPQIHTVTTAWFAGSSPPA